MRKRSLPSLEVLSLSCDPPLVSASDYRLLFLVWKKFKWFQRRRRAKHARHKLTTRVRARALSSLNLKEYKETAYSLRRWRQNVTLKTVRGYLRCGKFGGNFAGEAASVSRREKLVEESRLAFCLPHLKFLPPLMACAGGFDAKLFSELAQVINVRLHLHYGPLIVLNNRRGRGVRLYRPWNKGGRSQFGLKIEATRRGGGGGAYPGSATDTFCTRRHYLQWRDLPLSFLLFFFDLLCFFRLFSAWSYLLIDK